MHQEGKIYNGAGDNNNSKCSENGAGGVGNTQRCSFIGKGVVRTNND